MLDLLSELTYAMAGELELYMSLLQYARQKKRVLIDNDVDQLTILVKLEEEQLAKLGPFTEMREKLFTRIAAEDGYDGKITLGYIQKRFPPAQRRELDRLSVRYQQVIRELSALNRLNQSLLQTQLQYTAFCMEAITQAHPVGSIYGSTGYANSGFAPARRLIDREA